MNLPESYLYSRGAQRYYLAGTSFWTDATGEIRRDPTWAECWWRPSFWLFCLRRHRARHRVVIKR